MAVAVGEPEATVAPLAPTNVLVVKDLRVGYGDLEVLRAVNFTVAAGEVVGIAGENGAGKTTLVRCVAGDLEPRSGEVRLFGQPVATASRGASPADLAVVWQDLSLCDNLDVADNLMLGREPGFVLGSGAQLHVRAREVLRELGIPLTNTAQRVSSLSGGQRQMLALARAMRDHPRLLLFDEPTAALGANESAEVERLIRRLRGEGVTIILISHDLEQLFRLADRILVLRAGAVAGDVDPTVAHVDDLVALMSGQQPESSPRGQLTRLHGLVERLASSDRSSGLSLILSALAAALGAERLAIHALDGEALRPVAALGLSDAYLAAWSPLDVGDRGGPVGRAALGAAIFTDDPPLPLRAVPLRERGLDRATWAVPIIGSEGVSGVITLLRRLPGGPDRDELDLVTLYCGYAAAALERERLFGEISVRNDVLETIRDVLETLAGPVPFSEAIAVALRSLCQGLGAAETALVFSRGEAVELRSVAAVPDGSRTSPELADVAAGFLADSLFDGVVRERRTEAGRFSAVSFATPEGHAALLARSDALTPAAQEHALMADASHSLRLALEREAAGVAHQEAAALRRSRELQREFLSRLSHELRTPLTAIRGYASSLMQADVTWDRDSELRFLSRMASESARLGRLVGDLLDFSAIEAGVLRLQRDWCDLPLVLEAAIALLPPDHAAAVALHGADDLPAIWADHDRLEQVFLNIVGNAFRHNPEGVHVEVTVAAAGAGDIAVLVEDDGGGIPTEIAAALFEPGRRGRSPTAGTGLGISIAKAIVDAHGGVITLEARPVGAAFAVRLPVEARVEEENGEG